MPFKKGNKLGGRPKGAKNKTSKDLREKYTEHLYAMFPGIKRDLNSLKPVERVQAFIQLSKFALPQLKAIEFEDKTERNTLAFVQDLAKLDPTDLDYLAFQKSKEAETRRQQREDQEKERIQKRNN